MTKTVRKILSEEEKKSFLDQFNIRYQTPHRNLCMVQVMLEAGLRVSEVVSLKPEHADLDEGKVIVREGKGGKDRIVWIGEDLCNMIREWMDRRTDSEWLFPTSKGTQVQTRYMRAMVGRMARRARISEADRVSPHTMRHTAATDLLKKTGNVELVRRMLGHADIRTTQEYVHLVDMDLKQAMIGVGV